MRRFYRTTLPDNTGQWLLPVLEPFESQPEKLRNTIVQSPGEDGGYDVYQDDRAPREAGGVDLDFIMHGEGATPADNLQAAIAAMYVGLGDTEKSGGRRKLWSREADGTDPRWARIKLDALEIPKARHNILHVPVSAQLILPDPRYYDPISATWLGDNGYTSENVPANELGEPIEPDRDFAVYEVTSSPFAFTLTNDGPLTTRLLVFRFEANAVDGFTNPAIINTTTGQSFSSTTDGPTTATVLQVNCVAGLGRARLSANNGVSWVGDTLNLSLGVTQAVIMELAPGDNVMSFTSDGVVNMSLLAWWAHAWRD